MYRQRAEALHRNSSCACRCSARRTPTLSARAHGSVLLRPPNICTHRQLPRVTTRTLALPAASSCTASRAAHESASHPHAASLLGTRASAPGPSRVHFLRGMRLHSPALASVHLHASCARSALLLSCTPKPHHLLPLATSPLRLAAPAPCARSPGPPPARALPRAPEPPLRSNSRATRTLARAAAC
jgi:hypothetical protein